jgi:hypothetical protein
MALRAAKVSEACAVMWRSYVFARVETSCATRTRPWRATRSSPSGSLGLASVLHPDEVNVWFPAEQPTHDVVVEILVCGQLIQSNAVTAQLFRCSAPDEALTKVERRRVGKRERRLVSRRGIEPTAAPVLSPQSD